MITVTVALYARHHTTPHKYILTVIALPSLPPSFCVVCIIRNVLELLHNFLIFIVLITLLDSFEYGQYLQVNQQVKEIIYQQIQINGYHKVK